jgi:Ni/Fe-hydrogenase subunit HybB-like protein
MTAWTPAKDKQISTVGYVILVVLAVVAAAGLVAGIYRLANGLGATTNLSDAYPWGLWIVLDFTLIAFSGAAFTLSLLVYIFNLEKYHGVLRQAILTGFLGYVAVLVILLVDLGRWDRFWAFIVYPNIHSPLFEISWCILLYTFVLSLEVLPTLFERFNQSRALRTLQRWGIVIVIAGITLSTLHQSTLGTLYAAMPYKLNSLWWTPLLPIMFFLSAVGMGLSATILVALLAGWAFDREVDLDVLGGLAKGSAWLWTIYLLVKLEHLFFTRQFDEAFALDKYSIAYLAEIGIGVIIPTILYALPSVRKSKAGLLVASLFVTGGVLLNRLNATLIGQTVTQSTWSIQSETVPAPTYTPSLIEWAVLLGVLAVAVLAWFLAARHLPFFLQESQEAEAP